MRVKEVEEDRKIKNIFYNWTEKNRDKLSRESERVCNVRESERGKVCVGERERDATELKEFE